MTERKPPHLRMVNDSPDFPFQIPGAEKYGVTRDGRVCRLDTGHWLNPCAAKRGGYLMVSLWWSGKGHPRYVHQLVAITFHGPRPTPKHDAAHADGNKLNNHYTNLRWATRAENEHDKIAHGRSNRGDRNGGAKLTDEQARELIRRAATLPRSSGGCRLKKGSLILLAREYGITRSGISQIITGRRRINERANASD